MSDASTPAPAGAAPAALVAPKWKVFLAAFAVVLAADQATKQAVIERFAYGERLRLVDGLLDLTHVRNPGGAFSFLAQLPPDLEWVRPLFFVGMAGLAIALLLGFFARLPAEARFSALALGSVLGGALGNLLDRLRHGEVVDFIDVHLTADYTWPTFNVADSAIVVGVVLLLLETFLEGRARGDEGASDAVD
ncbi:MAG: signal peptidase II [Myxococcota bacterium]